MSTTALIIEIIVSGIFTLLWIVLLILKIYGINVEGINLWVASYKEYAKYAIFLMFPVAYQLGWIMNYISYIIVGFFLFKKIRNKTFKEYEENYASIKSFVFLNAPSDYIKRLEEGHAVVRMCRAGVINFFILGVISFIYGSIIFGFISMIVSTLCLLQTKVEYKIYYEQISYFYKSKT